MFDFLKSKSKPAPTPKVEMTADEITVIKGFALGNAFLRDAAIAIHYKYIRTIGVRGNPYQVFLAEIDNPVPDRRQIAAARAAILD